MKNKNKTTLKIEFDNEKIAHHFASWLCDAGEQDYWEWMRIREKKEKGDITAIDLQYHGPEDLSKDISDPSRYGKFLCDLTIRTVSGRISRKE